MVDTEYLTRLIRVLKDNQVTHYKVAGLELSFDIKSPEPTSPSQPQDPTLQSLPDIPDLRADDAMNFDKILNWSGSNDQEEQPLPLTGEEHVSSP